MGTTVRTEDIVEDVLANIAEGIPLAELCRKHGIGRSTWYDWMAEDKPLAGRFAHARERGFDAIAEETLEIADDGSNDWMDRKRADGSTEQVVNQEHVARSRLRVDTRLKLLAKWDPKRYGEMIKHANADGTNIDMAAAIAEGNRRVLESGNGDES